MALPNAPNALLAKVANLEGQFLTLIAAFEQLGTGIEGLKQALESSVAKEASTAETVSLPGGCSRDDSRNV